MEAKSLNWTKPVLVELGSARRMSFGNTSEPVCEIGVSSISICQTGTAAEGCDNGGSPVTVP